MRNNGIKLGAIWLVMMMVIMVFPSNVSGEDYPDGMVSYWKLDENSGSTAYDSVDDNDGNIIDNPTWTKGKVNNALSFDGYNDFINFGNGPGVQIYGEGKSFSLEAWTFRRSSGSWDIIFAHSNKGYAQDYRSLHFGYEANNRFLFSFYYCNLESSLAYLDVNEWHHWVGTYDGSTNARKLFRDSVLIDSDIAHHDLLTTSGYLYVGHVPYIIPGNDYFHGMIDEVAIYNRVLSAEEINQHYENGLVGYGYGYEYLSPEEKIQGQITNVEDLELPEGIEESLVSKLDGAISALEKDQDTAAVNKLNAFINAVEAQRGKKITEGDADELIEIAELIIDNI